MEGQRNHTEDERSFMRRAIALAQKGIGYADPNPLVGAVIVREGRIIGEGWHARYGEAHAERNALAACTEDPRGADIYVTLEPCCHQGKQPPCTQALIDAGIARVFIGSSDPNPLVAGKGVAQLREAGIEVIERACKDECDEMNKIFFHYITHKTPYVILKIAMTADGKTATRAGLSKWITGPESRRHVHMTRKRCMAIMIGIGTVLADDPSLTCRIEDPRDPIRVICDTNLQIPMDSQLVITARKIPTYIATCSADSRKAAALRELGVNVLEMPSADGRVDLRALMRRLGSLGISSVLLEGGAALHEAALRAGIVQHVQTYIAPKVFGGVSAKPAVGGLGVYEVGEAYRLTPASVSRLGDDVLLEYDVEG